VKRKAATAGNQILRNRFRPARANAHKTPLGIFIIASL
jgi:hypothetical protein